MSVRDNRNQMLQAGAVDAPLPEQNSAGENAHVAEPNKNGATPYDVVLQILRMVVDSTESLPTIPRAVARILIAAIAIFSVNGLLNLTVASTFTTAASKVQLWGCFADNKTLLSRLRFQLCTDPAFLGRWYYTATRTNGARVGGVVEIRNDKETQGLYNVSGRRTWIKTASGDVKCIDPKESEPWRGDFLSKKGETIMFHFNLPVSSDKIEGMMMLVQDAMEEEKDYYSYTGFSYDQRECDEDHKAECARAKIRYVLERLSVKYSKQPELDTCGSAAARVSLASANPPAAQTVQ